MTIINTSSSHSKPIKPTPTSKPTSTSKPIFQSIPVKNRSIKSKSINRLIIFNSLFFISLLLLHSTQLIFFPLIFFKSSFNGLFWKINSFAKQVFGIVLVVATQIFAPTKLVITLDDDHDLDLRKIVKRDRSGRVISLDLPKRSVTMANHQIYADWLYIWCLAYLAEIHGSIIIILKASLKWVPIVGPAMQLFSFIFLNRSWSLDKSSLTEHLTTMANQTTSNQPIKSNSSSQPLTLLIFPEGTLVSPLTRPISQKYADKNGLTDLKHCLLPRSTGILFCIRALSRKIPDLQLIDLTIGYPGIPAYGNGQDFYTLQSIFGYGHSPPKVHLHLRLIPISSIPIGTSHLKSMKDSSENPSELIDPTTEESIEFDKWLRSQWKLKDERLERFYQTGEMCEEGVEEEEEEEGEGAEEEGKGMEEIVLKNRLEIQIRLRKNLDWMILIGLYAPGLILIWLISIWFMIGFKKVF
ncbi:acyltransferase-domain-containing protein [Melampsora americana]|nr:acyltransferase-domain-containing protein [Melampsora americana]